MNPDTTPAFALWSFAGLALVVSLLLGIISIFWIAGSGGRLRGYLWGFLAIGLSSMGLLAIVVSWFVVTPGGPWRNGEPGLAPFIYPVTNIPNYPFNAVAKYEIDFDDLEWKPAFDPGESLDWLAGVSAGVQHRLTEIAEDLDMKPAKGLKFEIATATSPDDHTMKTEIAAHARRERGYEQELSRARDEIEKVLDAELGKKVKNRSWRVSMTIEPEER